MIIINLTSSSRSCEFFVFLLMIHLWLESWNSLTRIFVIWKLAVVWMGSIKIELCTFSWYLIEKELIDVKSMAMHKIPCVLLLLYNIILICFGLCSMSYLFVFVHLAPHWRLKVVLKIRISSKLFLWGWHVLIFLDMFRSLSIPLPNKETLSRHSFLGPNGLRGQWLGPSAEIKVTLSVISPSLSPFPIH